MDGCLLLMTLDKLIKSTFVLHRLGVKIFEIVFLLLWLVGRIALQFLLEAPSSPLLVPPFSLLVTQTRMVPAEDTLTFKSILVFDTR